jgi:hypothetical protein
MAAFTDQQAPIDRNIVSALIAATPESWDAAEMVVEREQEGEVENLTIEITSPEGRREIVEPTEDIYEYLYALSDLFREHGRVWKKLKYSIELNEEGNWKYHIDFGY